MRIPQELLNIPRWVCCTADKLPIDPKTGKAADSTDPATWADYATAAAAVTPQKAKRPSRPGTAFRPPSRGRAARCTRIYNAENMQSIYPM